MKMPRLCRRTTQAKDTTAEVEGDFEMEQNLICAVFNLIPGASGHDVFPEQCPEVDDTFPSFATIVIVLITGIALFFR